MLTFFSIMCNKMASSKKKRVDEVTNGNEDVDDVDSNIDDVDDEESVGDEEPITTKVHVDLEARIPEDSDFNGMKTLLQQVFLKANIDLTELTNTIISQNYIGSVMKQPHDAEESDDDDDSDDSVLALTTVINITERKELACIQQIQTMLQDKCQQCAMDKSDKFKELLNDPDHHVGYLINERFLNLPPNVAVPMFESLIKEMETAKKKNMKYDFTYYLLICKTFEMKTAHNVRSTFYSNSEEELFEDVSGLYFRYSVAHERDSGMEKWNSNDEMEPFRTVIVFPADKLQSVIDKINVELTKA